MQDYYARRAPEYDRIYLKPERQADLRELERWLAAAFEGRRVLEIACGTGYWTQFIAPGAMHMRALDAAVETLDIARTRVPADKVEFLVGDTYALERHEPLPDAAFAGFWFSHVPLQRRLAFLAGLHAVLTPGARVVLIDNRWVAGSSTPLSHTDADGNTYQRRPLDDGSSHTVLKNFPSEQELRALLAELGARQVRHRAWTYFWAIEYFTTSR